MVQGAPPPLVSKETTLGSPWLTLLSSPGAKNDATPLNQQVHVSKHIPAPRPARRR